MNKYTFEEGVVGGHILSFLWKHRRRVVGQQ